MSDQLTIVLSSDEALVLFEFFARFSDSDDFSLRHNAEFIAFNRVAAQLERSVTGMFDADYSEKLDAARGRISEGYEGDAPGVIRE